MQTQKKCNVQTCPMLCMWIFVLFFSMHKAVWPADTKVANLAQHPKSLGTAALFDPCSLNDKVTLLFELRQDRRIPSHFQN